MLPPVFVGDARSLSTFKQRRGLATDAVRAWKSAKLVYVEGP